MRLSALAFIALLGAAPALAQTAKPAAAPPPGPPQPIKLDLIPLPEPWTKVCQKDPSGAKEFCRTVRAFGQAIDQPPLLVMAVDTLSGADDHRTVRLILPEGLLLRPGFRLVLDKGDPVDGRFSICQSGSDGGSAWRAQEGRDRFCRGAQPNRRGSDLQHPHA